MMELKTYQVLPKVPKPLTFLEQLARNLWWCWKPAAVELFRRIDPILWEESGRNPLVLLNQLPQQLMEELSEDDSFLAHQTQVKQQFESQVLNPERRGDLPFADRETIAYFSMEFGIHESIPIFAGGLGVLAGDHLKASSDTALPLTGVGLLYQQGYFRQFLDQEGRQQEKYPDIDLFTMPVERVRDGKGCDVRVSVPGPDGQIQAAVWILRVGRVPLYMLDTNLQDNHPDYRRITASLYAGDQKMRLCQELVLGIGGMRALNALGATPRVCHMNEGHSSFSALERLAMTMESYDVELKTAMEIVPRSTVFTTHTPVAAGHDEFPADMVKPAMSSYEERLGVTVAEILAWGQPRGSGADRPFSMFLLGRHLAQHCNGVSELHGKVARRMWAQEWPGLPDDEIPISHVTNGVHLTSWVSPEINLLFVRYISPQWDHGSLDAKNAERIASIYDEDLWRAHEMSRSRLVRTCRKQLIQQYRRRNEPKTTIEEIESVLDPDILTIGFARRFATYKRAYLLLTDEKRLESIFNSEKHPVQIIFAGKAHPEDKEAKDLIQRIVQFSRKPGVRGKVVFLEDYDMHLARHMYQGADVWLNTPRRPFEACGTSGMKAAVNGVLNVSILDGWWAEGYSQQLGWRIGNGEEGIEDKEYQDALEAQSLYNVLENDVIPAFYDRKNGEAPAGWIQMMKASMQMAMDNFCSLRMLNEYENRFYFPASRHFGDLTDGGARKAKSLAAKRDLMLSNWEQIRVESPAVASSGPFRVGEEFPVSVVVHLGSLRPADVAVQVYYGMLEPSGNVVSSSLEIMSVTEDLGDGTFRYECSLRCEASGRYGFTARVIPDGDEWIRNTPGLVTWAASG